MVRVAGVILRDVTGCVFVFIVRIRFASNAELLREDDARARGLDAALFVHLLGQLPVEAHFDEVAHDFRKKHADEGGREGGHKVVGWSEFVQLAEREAVIAAKSHVVEKALYPEVGEEHHGEVGDPRGLRLAGAEDGEDVMVLLDRKPRVAENAAAVVATLHHQRRCLCEEMPVLRAPYVIMPP